MLIEIDSQDCTVRGAFFFLLFFALFSLSFFFLFVIFFSFLFFFFFFVAAKIHCYSTVLHCAGPGCGSSRGVGAAVTSAASAALPAMMAAAVAAWRGDNPSSAHGQMTGMHAPSTYRLVSGPERKPEGMRSGGGEFANPRQ